MNNVRFGHLMAYIGSRNPDRTLTVDEVSEVGRLVEACFPPQLQHVPVYCDEMTLHTLMKAMAMGQKIEAIKAHRQLTGYGLKESKDIVEKYLPN